MFVKEVGRELHEVSRMRSFVEEVREKEAKGSGTKDLVDQPNIVVIGVGGAGNNMVGRIANMGIRGAQLMAVNTDRQHFQLVPDNVTKILIGESVTRGLGAGGNPSIGRKAAEVSRQTLQQVLSGADLVFLLAGMGGGTGTGAAPVVAQVAREQGAIVASMVTYPFRHEKARMLKAEQGIQELAKYSDTVIVLDNNRLVELVPNLPFTEALKVIDLVVAKTVQGITETLTQVSLINIDYADLRAIMTGGGLSTISVGEGRGVNKVYDAVEEVLKNKLLDVNTEGAKGVLIHITGGPEMSTQEAVLIGDLLTERVDPNAQVTWGARIDPSFEDRIQVIAIFTGVQSPYVRLGDMESEGIPDLGLELLR